VDAKGTAAEQPRRSRRHGDCDEALRPRRTQRRNRRRFVAAAGSTIYVAGGYARGNPTSALWSYDATRNRWGVLSPLPQPRAALGLVLFNGRLHAIGGNGGGSVTDHEVYNPAENTWQRAAPLPVGRDHLCVAAFDGKIYAIGGRINSPERNVDRTDIYDPRTDTWSAGAPMLTARSGVACAVYRGRIHVIGGESPRGTFVENEAYDPINDAWSTFAPLPEGRHGTGAAAIGDAIYVPAGGPTPGGSRSNTLYVFSL
jgi:N-acetylneuraminic acid mutarotase